MTQNNETHGGLGGRELRRVVYSEAQIRQRVGELGAEATEHYGPGGDLLVVGLLKGSFIFMADLVRTIRRPLNVDFLVASSYGSGTESSGHVRLLYDPEASFRDRHILLVEDIIDSGTTLEQLVPQLLAREPRSLEICTLLHKRKANLSLEARWVGFEAPNEFLVGYGLDFAEDFRHLPFIGSI